MSLATQSAALPAAWVARSQEEPRTAGTMPEYKPSIDPATGQPESGFKSFILGLIDVVNPLQHIPVVSSIYRSITGDQMGQMARLVGDTIYGGPAGTAMALANIAVEGDTGRDIGGTMLASLTGRDTPAAAVSENVQVASAETAHTTAAAAQLTTDTSAGEIIWNTPADFMAAQPAAVAAAPAASVAASAASPVQAQPSAFVQSLPHVKLSSQYSSPSLSGHPTPNRTRTAQSGPEGTQGPDTLNVYTRPDETSGTPVRPESASPDPRLTAQADKDTSLALPEAPADARMAIPPELMAQKMQEALDKYAAMKASGLSPESALH